MPTLYPINRFVQDAIPELGGNLAVAAHEFSPSIGGRGALFARTLSVGDIRDRETCQEAYSVRAGFGASIKIRSGLRAGISSMLRLHAREYLAARGFGLRFEAFVAEGLGRFAMQYHAEYDRAWIAEDGAGEAVGSVAVARASEREAQLRWFIVDAEMRGRGLGRALLREAIAFARSRGYASLFLWTLAELESAVHLYRGEGFVLMEEKINDEWAERPVTEQRYVLKL